ncbi:MAG: hypothetical protein M3R63_05650 [Actinomycetota bacterium]|nr:hypothetical protein [Actinomycetota bacterium]
MASQADQDADVLRPGDDDRVALVAQLCAFRDDIHRLAAEMAEGVATPEQHRELAVRLQRVSAQVTRRGRRLVARRGVSEP